MLKSEIKKVKVSEIIIPEHRLRAYQDQQSSLSLKKSIEKYGVLQPVILRKTVNGYELIAGESRVKYAQEKGIQELEARVYEQIDDLDAKIISVIENVARGRLNLSEFVSTLEELYSKGYNITEIAELFGYDKSYISRFLKLRNEVPQLKQAVLSGMLDINVADEISKVKDEARKLDTLETVLTMANVSSRDELISFVKHYGRRQCDKCQKENVQLFIVGDKWLCEECTPKSEEGKPITKEIYLDRLQCFMGMHEVERFNTSTVFICKECLEKLEYFRNMVKAVLGLKFHQLNSEILDKLTGELLEARERIRREKGVE